MQTAAFVEQTTLRDVNFLVGKGGQMSEDRRITHGSGCVAVLDSNNITALQCTMLSKLNFSEIE